MSHKYYGGFKLNKLEDRLTSGGIALNEMLKLLKIFKDVQDYKELRQLVFEKNYLSKNSDSRMNRILEVFNKRFLDDLKLPSANKLSLALNSKIPEEVKRQILFPYYLFSDKFLRFAYEELVVKSIEKGEMLSISNADVVDFLKQIESQNKPKKKWADSQKKKWATRFLTFLRTFGILEKHPNNKLKKPYLFPETFGFFTLWFIDNNVSFHKIKSNELWRLYMMDETKIFELMEYGNKKDWWHFDKAGQIVSFEPKYSLEEWLKRGLG